MKLSIDDTFNTLLPVDFELENMPRDVYGACSSFVSPKIPANPKLLHVSPSVATLLGITEEETQTEEFLSIFSGKKILKDTKPYAMAYGGHQFGHWAGQLGDGRAINLAEVFHLGQRYAMQLKGAGKTPYSRSGDGLAVLRSSVREHLCSEAMHGLGVPTTRSLSLMLTGENVLRDMLYDGNAAYEKGAVVCRVAPTFLRFGNYQLFSSRSDSETLTELVDYTISHFYPDLDLSDELCYNHFFQSVVEATLAMVVHWQRVGFVHGVMNSDNMSILGLTIDYGPYGWTDDYNIDWTPNTTDKHQRRYRFGDQPKVALWNLWQLANALLPITADSKGLESSLQWYQDNYAKKYQAMMLEKLGLYNNNEKSEQFISNLESLLQKSEIDMTIFFRQLASVSDDINLGQEITAEFIHSQLAEALYQPERVDQSVYDDWLLWFKEYQRRVGLECNSGDLSKSKTLLKQRVLKMNQLNPKYVLRNYMAQLAIDAADNGDLSLINEIFEMLKNPYEEQDKYQKWFSKRPDWAKQKVGCSMLSCSS